MHATTPVEQRLSAEEVASAATTLTGSATATTDSSTTMACTAGAAKDVLPPTKGTSRDTETDHVDCAASSRSTETRRATGHCRPTRSTSTYTKKATASAVASLLGSAYKSRGAGGTAESVELSRR